MKTRQVVLLRRPVGLPQAEDFAVREAELPEPGAGEVLVRNVCMSVDPYMRVGWWTASPTPRRFK